MYKDFIKITLVNGFDGINTRLSLCRYRQKYGDALSSGKGLRPKINLENYFGQVLDNFLEINIGTLTIPFGFILFFFLLGLIVYIFQETKMGITDGSYCRK